MRFLQVKPDRYVSELKDGGAFDLADFLELTGIGRRWITRVREIERDTKN